MRTQAAFAPNDFAKSLRPSSIERGSLSGGPGTRRHLTMPPLCTTASNTRKPQLFAASVTSHSTRSQRRSGLSTPYFVHRLGVRHPPQRQLDLDAEHVLPQRRDQALHRGLEDLLVDERHLDIDLRELGLAIEAEVLVAEAAHDLEVALVARDHQQLLEDLRRLGERVERAGVEPRRHEEVTRAARRVLHHERRLHLEEAVLAEVVARHARDRRAHDQILLQLRPAQIEVAILEAQLLVGVDLVLDLERRRLGLREHLDALDPHLDRAGRQLVVDVAAARADLADDADAPLASAGRARPRAPLCRTTDRRRAG